MILEPDDTVVVTRRCSDSQLSPDVDTIPCSVCGYMTWISTSFRDKKIDKIVCEHCFEDNEELKNEFKKEDFVYLTEDCIDEAISIAQMTVKNLKGKTRDEIKKEMIEIVEYKLGKKIKIVKNIEDGKTENEKKETKAALENLFI